MATGTTERNTGGDTGRLFRSLLPADVLVAEMDPADADPTALYPEEQAQIANAVPTRRCEYAAGRLLARSLLPRLGVPVAPLLSDSDRVPSWPSGIVGSITHCRGWCAVALARASQADGIGIDIEPAQPLPQDLAPRILTALERERIAALPSPLRMHAERLVFCAKEAAYKALFPRTRSFLDFPELQVDLDGNGSFLVTPAGPTMQLPELVGRYGVSNGYLATAVVLPPNTLPRHATT